MNAMTCRLARLARLLAAAALAAALLTGPAGHALAAPAPAERQEHVGAAGIGTRTADRGASRHDATERGGAPREAAGHRDAHASDQ